jgi:hypothetical protein
LADLGVWLLATAKRRIKKASTDCLYLASGVDQYINTPLSIIIISPPTGRIDEIEGRELRSCEVRGEEDFKKRGALVKLKSP